MCLSCYSAPSSSSTPRLKLGGQSDTTETITQCHQIKQSRTLWQSCRNATPLKVKALHCSQRQPQRGLSAAFMGLGQLPCLPRGPPTTSSQPQAEADSVILICLFIRKETPPQIQGLQEGRKPKANQVCFPTHFPPSSRSHKIPLQKLQEVTVSGLKDGCATSHSLGFWGHTALRPA